MLATTATPNSLFDLNDHKEPRRFTVGVSGGLGNQLFQYATGRACALRNGCELRLDLSFYRSGRHRCFELGEFPIVAGFDHPQSSPRVMVKLRNWLRKTQRSPETYMERHFHFDAHVLGLTPPILLKGYFQSERYFADFASTIRSELQPPVPSDPSCIKIGLQMTQAEHPTSIHVRRGDYVTSSKAQQVYATCSMDYYSRAIERIPGTDPVYVFSDDPEWAAANLPKSRSLEFVGLQQHRTGLEEFWLMTQCRHHVIANSTFSWWSAWLSERNDGVTIAPKHWFVDPALQDQDLIPAHWQRI